ncbi:hypothetical protein PPL_05460 [Heterostelium album PN500]|uniref:Uncharacterized protein n=1 Tax=Heterostelium pallidum (strain ATCC 26659 / Pp 5 / PN500) TaxID=670386 RepID=D3BA85_HETP5|nr:hypothetical protein PPL_05460 [Heterostelium album PN500]EFA81472.1 hypothetical protein PPL_05460 [Heterostelium album PN500]|eukprot:XP_020433590.1 hypothetical protein PPL_05460 [Heterostelium album PN500]
MASFIKKIKNDKKNKNQQLNINNNNNNVVGRENSLNPMQNANQLSASQTLVRKPSNTLSSPVQSSSSFSYSSSPIANSTNLKKSLSYSPNSNQPDVVSPKKNKLNNINNNNNNSSSNNSSNNCYIQNHNNFSNTSQTTSTTTTTTTTTNTFQSNRQLHKSAYELVSPSSRLPSSASMYFSPKLQPSPPDSPPLSPTSSSATNTPPVATLSSKKSLMFLDFGGSRKKQQQIEQQSQQLRENVEEMDRLRSEVASLNQAANNYLKDKFKSEEEIQNLQKKNRDLSKTNEYLLKLLSEYRNDINNLRHIIEHPTAVLSDSTISIPSPSIQTPPASPDDHQQPTSLAQQALVEDAIASINDAMTFIFSKPPTANASPYRRYLREKKKSLIFEQKILQQQKEERESKQQQKEQQPEITKDQEVHETEEEEENDDDNFCNNSLLNGCETSKQHLIPTPPICTSPDDISDTTSTTTSTSSSPLESSPILKPKSCTFLQHSISQPSSTITSPQTLSISITSVSSVSDANSSIDITPPSTASNTATANTPTTQSQHHQLVPHPLTISSSSPVSTSPAHSSSSPTTSASQALKRFNEERPYSPLNRTKSLMTGISSSQSHHHQQQQQQQQQQFYNSRIRLNDITNNQINSSGTSSSSSTSSCFSDATTVSNLIVAGGSGSNSSPSSPAEGSPRPQRLNSSCKYNTLSSNKQIFNSNKPRIPLSSSCITNNNSNSSKQSSMVSPIQPLSTSARPVLKSPSIPSSPLFDSANGSCNTQNNNNNTIKQLIHFFEPKPSFKL